MSIEVMISSPMKIMVSPIGMIIMIRDMTGLYTHVAGMLSRIRMGSRLVVRIMINILNIIRVSIP